MAAVTVTALIVRRITDIATVVGIMVMITITAASLAAIKAAAWTDDLPNAYLQ